MIERIITNLKTFPADGKHQDCWTGLPFYITKGKDMFYYIDKKSKERVYDKGMLKNKIDDRWIVFLKKEANPSLQKIFNIKVNKSLDVIIEYCIDVYKKSLQMEIIRLSKELKELKHVIKFRN